MVLIRSVTVLALASLGACAAPSLLREAPAGFLSVDDRPASYKATTANGAKFWIREFDDENDGELAFWAEALAHDFTENRGYELVSREPTHTASGVAGEAQHYRVRHDGVEHTYLICVFKQPGKIRVVEFVAERERFEANVASVFAAIATMP